MRFQYERDIYFRLRVLPSVNLFVVFHAYRQHTSGLFAEISAHISYLLYLWFYLSNFPFSFYCPVYFSGFCLFSSLILSPVCVYLVLNHISAYFIQFFLPVIVVLVGSLSFCAFTSVFLSIPWSSFQSPSELPRSLRESFKGGVLFWGRRGLLGCRESTWRGVYHCEKRRAAPHRYMMFRLDFRYSYSTDNAILREIARFTPIHVIEVDNRKLR